MALAVTFLAGCGGSPDPSGAAASPASSSTNTDTSASHAQASNTDPERVAQERRAEKLLARLATPGLDLTDWDQAHQELLALGPAAVPVLTQRLRDGSDVERELCATSLALLGTQSADVAAPLLAALEDRSEFVRANAAAALVQLPEHAPRAVAILVGLLDSDDSQLRQMAATNLNAVGPEAGKHVEHLAKALTRDDPPEVLGPVVELLGRIGRPAQAAVPGLQKIVFERRGELRDAASIAIQLITDAP